ncbi:hypothetical protein A0J61_03656 [Choanephora cucurbitarum]|uniref:Uncharacterized protein n=1 Tax=Choanephora cucurbitarum TaxID=101091 RepID=A0A1C7NGS3_9FUNG|nr:hypothetical protein A0J61_03656 [Choanephora cucurbitarum]
MKLILKQIQLLLKKPVEERKRESHQLKLQTTVFPIIVETTKLMSTYYNQPEKNQESKDTVYLPPIQQQLQSVQSPLPPTPQPQLHMSAGLDAGQKRTVPWLEDSREAKSPKTNEKQGNR